MFKLFSKKENKNSDVMNFIKVMDKKLADAYRYDNAKELGDDFSRELVIKISRIINAQTDMSERYDIDEKFIDREYEILEDSEDSIIVKRTINYKPVKSHNMNLVTGIDFSEIITVAKNNNNFVVTNIVAV